MGLALRDIADEIDTSHATLALYVRATAGIAPARWKDPDRYITDGERFRIKELLIEGRSIRYIAKVLDRAPSTISREVRRGSAKGTRGEYAPSRARRDAFEKRRRAKELKIPSDPVLHAAVQHGLDEGHSPEQVVGRLRREHLDDPRFHVSHETVYRTIYLQARGGLKRELKALTRTGRTVRHPRRSAQRRRGRIKDMVSIWERPAEALDRSVPGHWEGDLIVGKNGASAIGTVVERRSNYVILVHLDPTKSRVEATRDGLIEKLAALPDTLRATLTWDQGKEMHQHRQVTNMTGIDVYFADPHSPWQRATNENTNGLLRQYFPKGTDLSIHSQEDLDYIADLLNRRPRKRLAFATPYEMIQEYLLR
ncbi:IS30 family transposase [Brachybacterium halotolerans subsp. kimchii]|nr:IS30 family transposase [Brachybacterium halotolerans]UEJ81141.1 IS30 family transposase [Brachybacterium halotolerans subsp. kimchii]